FTQSFDIDAISQFVLGRYWRTATEAQRAEYQKLFQQFIVSSYAAKLGQYS
ncbi:ABC transporter substrate-binding protein, partial [Vibrio parahaemolyticus]